MASPQSESRFPVEGGSYRIVVGCEFAIEDPANIPEAIAKIEQAMTPATAEQCEGWLVMLQAATAHRQDSEITAAVGYTLYAAELRQWPADVAKYACARLARGRPGQTGTNWFPTLAELARECERAAAPRRVILNSLHTWAPKVIPYPTARGVPEPTEEDKARVKQMADDTAARLLEAAERRKAARARLPSIAGKPAEGSHLTPEMKALIERRENNENR